jgi:hypothetical protein
VLQLRSSSRNGAGFGVHQIAELDVPQDRYGDKYQSPDDKPGENYDPLKKDMAVSMHRCNGQQLTEFRFIGEDRISEVLNLHASMEPTFEAAVGEYAEYFPKLEFCNHRNYEKLHGAIRLANGQSELRQVTLAELDSSFPGVDELLPRLTQGKFDRVSGNPDELVAVVNAIYTTGWLNLAGAVIEKLRGLVHGNNASIVTWNRDARTASFEYWANEQLTESTPRCWSSANSVQLDSPQSVRRTSPRRRTLHILRSKLDSP